MLVVPFAFATTFPVEETVATDLLLDFQSTLFFVPFTFNCIVFPLISVTFVLFRAILLAASTAVGLIAKLTQEAIK